jgi:hypothetical protein
VPKGHVLLSSDQVFKMSAYLQELVCYVGQGQVFEEASEQLWKLSAVEISAKQIERVSHHYGQLLEGQTTDQGRDWAKAKEQALHYAMIDGAMVLTREEGYKEIKLGRVFKADSRLALSEKRTTIRESEYVAHLGSHEEFSRKFAFKLDNLSKLVFIADGAKWIWDYVEGNYGESVQILDYFHCKEKLCGFALAAFQEQGLGKEWVAEQQDLLLSDQVETVIANIALQTCKGEAKSKQQALLTYYGNNVKRMRYGSFQAQGLLIGSGAIEAAHRHVIQHRLKLSGQRWTKTGAQQIANLRVAKKSNQWHKILHLIQANI